jgi:flagellar FliL protein
MPIWQMGDIMKKNLLTIIILAIGILNMVLAAVLVFAVVPTTMRTNELISKVATSIDLELEGTNGKSKPVDIADIEIYQFPNDLTVNLKSTPVSGTASGDSNSSVNSKDNNSSVNSKNHYALVSVSLSINKKSEDYKTLQPVVESNLSVLKEIVSDQVKSYTMQEINTVETKNKLKEDILLKIQEYFDSDFIFSVSLNMVTE